MRLYEYHEAYINILALLDGDFSPEDREQIMAALEAIEGEYNEKAENIAHLYRDLTATSEAMRAEAQKLTEKARVLESRAGHLKDYVYQVMSSTGHRKLGTTAGWRVQKNPAQVQVADESEVPDEFKIPQPPKLDKKKMSDFMKSGGEIPGAELVQTEGARIW